MSYRFVQNRQCQYFPCHSGADPERFNCLFCYCPLYALGDRCGGSFTYTQRGIKDCSGCMRPHIPENYERVLEKMSMVMEIVKKRSL